MDCLPGGPIPRVSRDPFCSKEGCADICIELRKICLASARFTKTICPLSGTVILAGRLWRWWFDLRGSSSPSFLPESFHPDTSDVAAILLSISFRQAIVPFQKEKHACHSFQAFWLCFPARRQRTLHHPAMGGVHGDSAGTTIAALRAAAADDETLCAEIESAGWYRRFGWMSRDGNSWWHREVGQSSVVSDGGAPDDQIGRSWGTSGRPLLVLTMPEERRRDTCRLQSCSFSGSCFRGNVYLDAEGIVRGDAGD